MSRALWLVAPLVCACAPQAEVHETTAPLVGGVADPGDPAVVMSLAQVPGQMFASLCTAVIVSPHVALTAAHCVSPANVGDGAVYALYFGENAATAKVYLAASVDFDPKYDAKSFTKGHDIGAVLMTDAYAGTPLVFNQVPLDKTLIAQAATLVGYGITSAGDTASAAHKRTLDATLVSYGSTLAQFGMTGATACDGDSGGPAIMDIDGQSAVVGLVSFGNVACDTTVSYTRVDQYLDWIYGVVDKADPGYLPVRQKHSGCSYAGHPTPAPFALLLVGGVLLALRKRREPRA